MSASKDKIYRKQQIEAGTDKRSVAAAKEKAERRKTTITYSVIAVVLVVFFAFVFIYNSSWPSRHTTAVTIDGKDYSVAELNYYYSNAYLDFYNTYSTYVSYGLFFDPNESLADQEYSEGYSWRQYFLDTAVDQMAQVQMLNDQAEAAGFTMSEEQQDAYEAELESLRTSWQGLGYSNLKQFINMTFGKGVDEAMVERELYRSYLASAYSQSVYDGYKYTDQQLATKYEELADQLDMIEYAYYYIATPAGSEDVDEDDVSSALDPQAMAETLDGTDADVFQAYLDEHANGATATVQTLPGSSLSNLYADWLLADARRPGDTTAVDEDGSSYVVMYLSRDNNNYPTVGFRHILVQAQDTDGDGAFGQEEIDAAAARAQELYDQWKAGDATEESFAEMANEYSDDGGSNTNGGLYENVYKGAMVDPINEWLFASGRKAGDTTVVSYESPSYTGSHVVYFTGTNDQTYALYQAELQMRSDDYNAWQDEQLANYEPVTAHLGMAGKNH